MPQRKVTILKSLAGKETIRKGSVIELDADTAARYVEHGIAQYVEKATASKTAPPETEDAKKPAQRAGKATSRKARKSEKR